MAALVCCGFECGVLPVAAIGDPAGEHWITDGSGATLSTTTVRSGSSALRCNPTAGSRYVYTPASLTGFSTRWVGRFYVYFATLPSADTTLSLLVGSTGGPQIRFKQSDSKIYAAVGTTLGASGITVTTGIWYRIDFDWVINTGGNDTSDVRVDGTAGGQATAAGLSGGVDRIILGLIDNCTADVFFDDALFSATAGDYPLGAGYIHSFVPTSDGTHNIAGTGDFQRGNTGVDILNATTTAYQLIDEVPLPTTVDEADNVRAVAPPNTTDYVECIFGPSAGIPTPTVGPRMVTPIAAFHIPGSSGGSTIAQLNDNGTTDDFLITSAGVSTYKYGTKHYADPPSAASAWTVAGGNGNFNNVRVRFRTNSATPNTCLDGVLIEAEFSGDAPVVGAGHPMHRRFGGVPHLGTGRGTGGRAW